MSLEKIASKQELSKADVIAAAHEALAFEKEAALADQAGREAAHEYVEALLQKQAEAESKEEAEKEEKARTEKEEKDKAEKMEKKSSNAAAEISAAVEVLRAHGILNKA